MPQFPPCTCFLSNAGLQKTMLISRRFLVPHGGGLQQLNSPWVEMATLDPCRCPWRLPALLSPPDAEKTPGYWNKGARRRLELALALQPAAQRAKNIILFMGDGECPGSVPHPAAPQQQGDVAAEKMGLGLGQALGQCLGRAGLSLVPALCHP